MPFRSQPRSGSFLFHFETNVLNSAHQGKYLEPVLKYVPPEYGRQAHCYLPLKNSFNEESP